MPGRFHAVSGFASVVALGLMLGVPRTANAHRLDAQLFLLPGQNKVRVEAWFDNGTPARGAKVQVFGGEAEILAEGVTDRKAQFVFALPKEQPLRVVVTASGGHRKELDISPADWRATAARRENSSASATADSAPVIPLTTPLPEQRIKDLILGVGFLLALAAFLLSLRNARRLRGLGDNNASASTRKEDHTKS